MRVIYVLMVMLALGACNSDGGGDGGTDNRYLVGEWQGQAESLSPRCGGFPALDVHFFVDELVDGSLLLTDVAWTNVTVGATFDDRTIHITAITDATIDPRVEIALDVEDIGNGAMNIDGSVSMRGSGFPDGCTELLSGIGIHYQE